MHSMPTVSPHSARQHAFDLQNWVSEKILCNLRAFDRVVEDAGICEDIVSMSISRRSEVEDENLNCSPRIFCLVGEILLPLHF